MNYATSSAVKLTCVPSYGYRTLSRSLQMRHGVHRRGRPTLDALREDVDGEGRGALHTRDTRLSHKHVRALRRRWIVVHHQEVDASNEAGMCLISPSVCHCYNLFFKFLNSRHLKLTCIYVERGSLVVECRTCNRERPGSNSPLQPFRILGIFVLSIFVDSAV